MTREERMARICKLNEHAHRLEDARRICLEERHALEDEQILEDHPCSCVQLNSKMGIFNMKEQNRRGRTVIGYRCVVAESFTASRSCPICGGTGKPQ